MFLWSVRFLLRKRSAEKAERKKEEKAREERERRLMAREDRAALAERNFRELKMLIEREIEVNFQQEEIMEQQKKATEQDRAILQQELANREIERDHVNRQRAYLTGELRSQEEERRRIEGMLTEAQNARADELRMERERLANEAVGWEGRRIGWNHGREGLAVVLALVNVLRDV